MSQTTQPVIDYTTLEYLTTIDDANRVGEVIQRLRQRGVPVRVQSISVRSEMESSYHTYRLYVPASNIEIAREVALNGSPTA